jgi:bile acid:Na+ symporter, BASS family
MSVDEIQLDFDPSSVTAINIILAVIMFGVALDLKPRDFYAVYHTPKAPLIGLAAQFLVLPAFTFLLTQLMPIPPSVALGMILIAACPGGNMSNFIALLAGGNVALSVSMTAISSVAAIFLTPLNLALWGSMDPGTAALMTKVSINSADVLLSVAMMLGIPLALGLFVSVRFPKLALKLEKVFKYLSVGLLLTFIVVIFAKNWGIFIAFIGLIAPVVIIHNATALMSGYGAARLAGLEPRDRRSISIEVGIQNSALGLSLIFTFFGGLGGMAIVAGAWGSWHIVAGLTLAAYWSRKKILVADAQPETP